MHPVAFSTTLFGLLSKPWELHSYGVLIAIGFLLAMILAAREARHEGEDPDRIIDLAFYVLLTGLAGARLLYILTKLPEYIASPAQVLRFWQGGLVWYGGFIAAVLYVAWYCRRHRLPFFKYADIVVPYMALAHAFGRLGCFAAGCCFGSPTQMPWGVVFPDGSIVHQAQQSAGLVGLADAPLPVHPTQLYEAAVELTLFAVLLWLRGRKRYDGQVFLLWLIAYPVARTVIEMARGDLERGVYVFSTSQYLSVAVAVVAGVLYWKLRKGRAEGAAPVDTGIMPEPKHRGAGW